MKKTNPDKGYSKYSVYQIMTPAPVTITEDTTAEDALNTMKRGNFHHLPVMEKRPRGDGERIIGMIARGDLQRAISAFVGTKIETPRDRQTLKLKVKSFMSREVLTVPPDTAIRECADLLLMKGFNSAPVVDPETGTLIGIVTTTDLLQFLYDNF
ncbi:CBS domain-containing protein [bacterium]|nr:CBS domain-containing protein [bacterium]